MNARAEIWKDGRYLRSYPMPDPATAREYVSTYNRLAREATLRSRALLVY